MRILDLFCGEGGAGAGYSRVGFEVIGVDKIAQPKYPLPFVHMDAFEYLETQDLDQFDFIHASPPCQKWTKAQRIQKREHPDLIGPTRTALDKIGKPYVIENVEGSPLLDSAITLCGSMFGLHTYRHRLFESNWDLRAPKQHPFHVSTVAKMGRPLRKGDWYHAVGNFSGVGYIRADMEVPWMTRDGMRECIPPAYAAYVGREFLLGRSQS